jgi:hypothetical protein
VTLTIYRDLEQGSQDWLDARCGILTASNVGKLVTPTLKQSDSEIARGLIETLVAERITGHVEYVHPSFDMQRGTLDEPYARDMYAEHHAPVEEIGFAVLEIEGAKIGASPDGLVGDKGGLEIKSRKPRTQLTTILSGKIPTANLAQIHACMLVLDRDWWDYASYAGGWPLYVQRVHRDPLWDAAILEAATAFETKAAALIDTYTQRTAGQPLAERRDHFAEIEIGL